MNSKTIKSKNEIWFFNQIAKAEKIISAALEKTSSFNMFDKNNLKNAVVHASIIDVEMLQLLNEEYDEFENDVFLEDEE